MSSRVMSRPPLMLITHPLAPSIRAASSKGLLMAVWAASTARDRPEPTPIPSSAVPASVMTERTSAKSTLTRPGSVMMSLIPFTPMRRTSSALRKASCKGAPAMASRSRSLGMTIKVSTCSARRSMPSSACRILRRPSKLNGLVTMPTVRAPLSLATSATTGAAPVPVPPPIPAAMKTRSAPCRACWRSARDSSAAFWPMLGLPPAPSPRVSVWPN
mmetsp:Transcript_14370/g.33768  ORF Transcript_14370/g.33768 Transcript_14370/m.33768 type:complete len:216 (-) Transcript_14370:462-1109(-)